MCHFSEHAQFKFMLRYVYVWSLQPLYHLGTNIPETTNKHLSIYSQNVQVHRLLWHTHLWQSWIMVHYYVLQQTESEDKGYLALFMW